MKRKAGIPPAAQPQAECDRVPWGFWNKNGKGFGGQLTNEGFLCLSKEEQEEEWRRCGGRGNSIDISKSISWKYKFMTQEWEELMERMARGLGGS